MTVTPASGPPGPDAELFPKPGTEEPLWPELDGKQARPANGASLRLAGPGPGLVGEAAGPGKQAKAIQPVSAAAWMRVSRLAQDTDNQWPDIERFTGHHGWPLAEVYQVADSAWKGSEGGPAYRAELKRAMDDAWAGRYSVLVVWSLDRLTRLGAEDVLKLVRQFRERGCTIVSIKESWLNGSPEIQDVLLAFAGWMAQQESARRSERIKAGIARRRAEGGHVGRKTGAKDKTKRRRSGYVARWEQPR